MNNIEKKLLRAIGLAVLLTLNSVTTLAELNVFACEPEWGSLVQELGGDKVSVFNATTGLQDPHHIQARPSLIAKARRADLLICTGADLEVGWLPLLLRKAGNNNIQPGSSGHVMATNFVTLLDQPISLDRSEGDVHAAGNPHVQMDPYRIAVIAKALGSQLQKIDPDNAEYYQDKSRDFMKRWQAAIQGWQQQLEPLQGMPIVVHHKNWIYLQEWTGLKPVATLEPKAGIPPSADYLSKLITGLKQQPARMILFAAHQNSRSSKWLAERTNLPLVKLPFTVGGSEKATNLFELFNETVQLLLHASQIETKDDTRNSDGASR